MRRYIFLILCVLAPLSALATVNVNSGNLSHRQPLFAAAGGPLALAVGLIYNSRDEYVGELGKGWSHSYQIYLDVRSDGSMMLSGGSGRLLYFPDGNGGYRPRAGDFSSLVKNADNTWVVTLRSGLQYRFGSDRKLAAMVDRYGNTVSLDRSVANQLTVRDPAGRSVVLTFDTNGKLLTIADPASALTEFDYDGSGRLWKVISPAPLAGAARPVWEYLYTAQGLLEYEIDPEGNITKYGYDMSSRLIRTVDPEGVLDTAGGENTAGHLQTYQYGVLTAGQTTVTEKDGGIWNYSHDPTSFVLTAKTAPDGTVTSYSYYAAGEAYPGLEKEVVTPVDAATVHVLRTEGYDSYGNPTVVKSLSRPVGGGAEVLDGHLIYSYGSYDRVTSVTDVLAGTTATIDYTTTGGEETVTVTAPKINATDTSGPRTVLAYRADGQLKQVTDPLGRVTTDNYTVNGLPQSITDAISGITTAFSSHDALGRPQTVTVGKNGQTSRVTNLAYDALGRPTDVSQPNVVLKEGESPVALLTRFGYDLVGNRTSVTDAANRTTGFDYNARGDVTRITDALSQITVLEYGGAGCGSCGGGVDKLTAVIDANQVAKPTPLKTSFRYDQLGHLEREEDQLGKALLYTWTLDGRLKQTIEEPTGNVLVTASYLPDGRLDTKTVRSFNGVDQLTDFNYDTAGRLQSVTNPTGSYTFTYYANGWLKTVNDGTRTITYAYDAAGRRELVTVTQGTTTLASLDYVYDPTSKRLAQIVSAAGTFTFGTDAWGRRATLTYPNGVVAAYGYNGQTDWLTQIDYQNLGLTIGYPEYDKVGNRKQRVESGVTTSYAYDATDQLLQAKTGVAEENFTYDPVGNRKSGPTVKDTEAAAYAYNVDNRMTRGRKLSYTSDTRGNQRFRYLDAAHTKYWDFRWNGEDQLVRAILFSNGVIARTVIFKYDPFGRRIEKKVVEGATTTTHSYVYDGEDLLLETVTATGAPTVTTQYVHGPGIDEPLAMVRNGQSYYYHADGLGSVVAISDSSKAIVQRYTYESFGMLTMSNPAFANPYTYTGREWDPEIGLLYLRNRYLDLMEGRFISKDPIGLVGGDVNLYRYTRNQPINYIDPFGFDSWTFDIYAPWGGGIIFGENDDGSNFLSFKAGGGRGGGIKYNPKGQSSGYDPCQMKQGFNIALGITVEADYAYGPALIETSVKTGVHSIDMHDARSYFTVDKPELGVSVYEIKKLLPVRYSLHRVFDTSVELVLVWK
ncbi:MAG: RHS repeat protein [Desulfuromonas sp.]|nr:RHS repeat protein [Desulfuromonas sp.]